MLTCIYCGTTGPENAFNREHVIPAAFGSFKNALVLHGKVCADCNAYFASALDVWLARDTYEGLSRFREGGKPAKEYKSQGRRANLRVRLKDGPFENAFATAIVDDAGDLTLVPPPQVGLLRRESRRYDYFLLDPPRFPDELDLTLYDTQDEKGIIVLPLAARVQARSALDALGLPFPKSLREIGYEKSGREEVWTTVTTVVTETIKRAWAKIAFNYMAFFNNTAAMLSPALDQARHFVRFGTPPTRHPSIVSFGDRPILADEPTVGFRKLGHLITVNMDATGQFVFAQVSLYNQLTYQVLLSDERDAVARLDIRHGHFYNLGDYEVIELTPRSAAPHGETSD